MSRSTVADVIVDGLKRAGTTRLFGVAGLETNISLLEAARAGALPLTRASGETAACIMAAVTGDLVETLGAVAVGAGLGVTAAIPGVAMARVDRAPMIVLTDDHHEAIAACKASLRVQAESVAHWIAHAARLAATEPRGPVHLDIPGEVARRPALPLATSCRPDPPPSPDPEALDTAARWLAGASRPLLVAGLHCRSTGAPQWLRALAEALPAPVLLTRRAKGALPDPHPLMLGVLGGATADARLLKRADLVVSLGLDALEPVPASWWSTVPVLGFGPAQAQDGLIPALEVVGEVDVVLEELASRLHDRQRADWDVAELDRLKRDLSAGPGPDGQAPVRRGIVRIAREAAPADTIAAVDDGPHMIDVAVGWHAIAPREFLVSHGLTTSGFALPAAIAAHLVHPDRRIVCFTAVDGLTAAAPELETARRLGAPIVVIVFVGRASDSFSVARLAERVRLISFAADSEALFAQALGRALAVAGPSLIFVQP